MTIDYMHLILPSIYPPLDSEDASLVLDTPPASEPETNIVNVPVSDDAFICAICLDATYDEDSNYTQDSNTYINPNFDKKKHNLHFITSCNHHFHYGCLQKWCIRNNSCPSCRQQNILLPHPYVNNNNNNDNDNYNYRYNYIENNEYLNDFNNILQNSIIIDTNDYETNDHETNDVDVNTNDRETNDRETNDVDVNTNDRETNDRETNDVYTNHIDIINSQITQANRQLELALEEARLIVSRARLIAIADSVESRIINITNIETIYNRLNNNITNTINNNNNIINNIINNIVNNNIMLRM